ncbi:MAG TPA: hypothetical protein VKB93_11560, partial [Thermoanaerobaculia bacterium]|nr:hypothetical protein [Thermoanaerobaculia bacterium]
LISQLCENVIWLDAGKIVKRGPTREVIAAYMAEGVSGNAEWRPATQTSDAFEYHCVSIESDSADRVTIAADTGFEIVFDFTVKKPLPAGRLAMLIAGADGTVVLASANTDHTTALRGPWTLGRHRVRCVIPGHLLVPGQYYITITEPVEAWDEIHERVLAFTITEENSLIARDGRRGVVAPLLEWRSEPVA